MMVDVTADLKARLIAEIEELSPEDLRKIYLVVATIKDVFVDQEDEARYYTESWQQAEREAAEAYRQGGLPSFDTVADLMNYIEAGIEPGV